MLSYYNNHHYFHHHCIIIIINDYRPIIIILYYIIRIIISVIIAIIWILLLLWASCDLYKKNPTGLSMSDMSLLCTAKVLKSWGNVCAVAVFSFERSQS